MPVGVLGGLDIKQQLPVLYEKDAACPVPCSGGSREARGVVSRKTTIQKQVRLEKTFEALSMRRLPHAAFRTERAYVLEELEDTREDRLCRRYLFKPPLDLRKMVLNSWVLDNDVLVDGGEFALAHAHGESAPPACLAFIATTTARWDHERLAKPPFCRRSDRVRKMPSSSHGSKNFMVKRCKIIPAMRAEPYARARPRHQ